MLLNKTFPTGSSAVFKQNQCMAQEEAIDINTDIKYCYKY